MLTPGSDLQIVDVEQVVGKQIGVDEGAADLLVDRRMRPRC
jgi:hypothetical protein